jgi:hypothetical protein
VDVDPIGEKAAEMLDDLGTAVVVELTDDKIKK